MQTEITQPAVLTADLALTRLLAAYGVSARHGDGPQPRRVRRAGRRRRAVVRRGAGGGRAPVGARWRAWRSRTTARWLPCSAPLDEIEHIVAATDGYVVIANINSTQPGRHGRRHRRGRAGGRGARRARPSAPAGCRSATRSTPSIVAPVSDRCARCWRGSTCGRRSSRSCPTSTASSTRPARASRADARHPGRQVAAPVQFVKGLRTLYDAGRARLRRGRPQEGTAGLRRRRARRRRVLASPPTTPSSARHQSFNQALCGL